MNQSALQPLPVEQLQHPGARRLLAYWRKNSSGGALPAYAEFDSDEIRAMRPHLLVVERPLSGGPLRYATAGSAIIDRFRMDLAGLPLPPDAQSGGWSVLIRQALEDGQPAAGRGYLPGSMDSWVRFEIVTLPFADARGDYGAVVVGLFFDG